MSKIDKIIQIQMYKIEADKDYLMYGLSESGTLYSRRAGHDWALMIESPVVDNSTELKAERKLVSGISDEMDELVRSFIND